MCYGFHFILFFFKYFVLNCSPPLALSTVSALLLWSHSISHGYSSAFRSHWFSCLLFSPLRALFPCYAPFSSFTTYIHICVHAHIQYTLKSSIYIWEKTWNVHLSGFDLLHLTTIFSSISFPTNIMISWYFFLLWLDKIPFCVCVCVCTTFSLSTRLLMDIKTGSIF